MRDGGSLVQCGTVDGSENYLENRTTGLDQALDWVWRNQSPYLGSCGQDHRIGPGVGLGMEESEPLPGE